MATPAANLGGKNAAQSAKAWSMADLPIARHQLANARALLAAKFAEMAAPADARRYHGLGPVTEAEEASVESSLASIQEALDNFAVWSQAEQAATPPRYLQHCKDASDRVARLQAGTPTRYLQDCEDVSDRVARLQDNWKALAECRRLLERHTIDNRKALAECRRLLERHTDASSRPKFLNQLEGVARDSGVSFFSMEDGSTATAPTHCLSGQTFVLDLHLDAAGTVSWATLQRILSDGNSVPDEASVGQPQWDISAQMASPDMENALRGQFEALQLVEQVAVEALQTDTAAAAMSEAPDYRTGFGIVKRLVQGLRFSFYESGLRFSFYESASPASELETAAALLQLDGVIPAQARPTP
ncbi:hypothetical protein T484DRAFT_1765646 [Baffinella frigidus]|nr:hypothetical protein T484DRAFT_1765646 [Cryptophyta sp. CCMP2293]